MKEFMYNKLVSIAGQKKKDIVDVTKYSLYINFNQTMVTIYSYSSIDGIIPIIFE
jgi:hypothetical protein